MASLKIQRWNRKEWVKRNSIDNSNIFLLTKDEGGEGDAVGDQDDWEVSSATGPNTDQLNLRDFDVIVNLQ